MNQKKYFEDFEVGQVVELGATGPLSEQTIIDFAQLYDPQPIHTDPQAAATGFFNGLIASGWQTVTLCMRLLVDNFLNQTNCVVSPGVENISWSNPLRPGDSLTARLTVLELLPSKSRPTVGTVKYIIEAFNQNNQLVMKMSGPYLFYRRPQS